MNSKNKERKNCTMIRDVSAQKKKGCHANLQNKIWFNYLEREINSKYFREKKKELGEVRNKGFHIFNIYMR